MNNKDLSSNQSEVTPGGSRVIRSTPKTTKEMIGFPDSAITTSIEQREKIYAEMFGKSQYVSHELLPLVPHIDVYVYPPGYAKRPFYTLVSGGMSDMPMAIEAHVDHSYARREIILYCDTPEEKYVELVRFFARFPFKYSTWLGHGHSMPNGDPPQPLFENSQLKASLFSYSIVHPDQELGQRFIIDNDPVEFYGLYPLPKPNWITNSLTGWTLY